MLLSINNAIKGALNAMYNISYNYLINSKVFFVDPKTGGYSAGTVTQIDIGSYLSNTVVTNTVNYHLRLATGGTKTFAEYALFSDITGNPPVPNGSLSVNYLPGDKVWLADDANNTVSYASVAQLDAKIYSSYVVKQYLVNYESDDCHLREDSILVAESSLFASAYDALASIGIAVTPPPSPTPSGNIGASPTPTPTDTPSIGASPTPTPSVFVTPTPTPTPSAPPVSVDNNGVTLISVLNLESFTLYHGLAVSVSGGGVILCGNDTKALTFLGFVYDDFIPSNGIGRIILHGIINSSNSELNNNITESGTLQIGKKYYLAPNGKITATPPIAGYSRQIGFAMTSNDLDIRIAPSIKL